MKAYFGSGHSFWLLALLASLLLCGCGAQFSQQLEEALGPAARDKIQSIGAPGKDCALYRLNLTNTYGIVIGDHIMRLGDGFKAVRIVSQFATGNADNAVLQCTRADGAIDNYLFQAESKAKANLYQLDSHTAQPFMTHFTGDSAILMQNAATPGQLLTWTVSIGDVRGPSTGSMQSVFGQKKTGKSGSRPRSMPRIKKDNAFRLEADTPPAQSPAPAAAASPSSRQDAPYKAIEAPKLD